MTQYGYFDDAHFEYVITNPKTPVKWINYIGTLEFGGFVDQTGGALICKGDPTFNRITKYIPQMPASDFKGETLYVRINHPQGKIVYSPFFVPTLDRYDSYECHVGLGYNRYIARFYGIQTDITVFVPLNGKCEIRDIKITNLTKKNVDLDIIPVVEYTHPDALKQFTNADWVPQTMQSKAHRDENGMVTLIQYPFMFRDSKVNYFTSNHPASSFETDRAQFLGDHEYGTWANPLVLRGNELGNHEALRGDNIGAILHHLGSFKPGETKRLITIFGQEANLQAVNDACSPYRNPENVDRALAELGVFWQKYLSVLSVKTPDTGLNSMVNVHNPRQCFITRNWSRYLSLYQLGLGSRGIGFRDSSQDTLAVMAHSPLEAKNLIISLLSVQREDGSAMHQFNPLTMVGSEGDALEREDRPHYYGDDHLWAVLAVSAYLKESGDFNFLQQTIPFYNPKDPEKPLSYGSVLEHLSRAVQFTHDHCGQHGLPLLGFADWNDTINLATGAESVFVASLYGRALLDLVELFQELKLTKEAEAYQQWYHVMKKTVNEHAWDGEWYISYFDADGTPLGSHINDAGKIYVYGQAWPVIAGYAQGDRAATALNSVEKYLNTKNGIKLSMPGFNGFDPRRGGITTYPPGAKENGGIFLHVNPWVMIADCMAGNAERASRYYHQINPANKNEDVETFECEPYVYPQNILADEHPQFGLGRNSWLSGTASWAYQAVVQYILGVQPTYHGVKITPCIPPEWDGFEITRVFRGAQYHIRVNNPLHVSGGVAEMQIDGKICTGQVVPLLQTGQIHQVEITLG